MYIALFGESACLPLRFEVFLRSYNALKLMITWLYSLQPFHVANHLGAANTSSMMPYRLMLGQLVMKHNKIKEIRQRNWFKKKKSKNRLTWCTARPHSLKPLDSWMHHSYRLASENVKAKPRLRPLESIGKTAVLFRKMRKSSLHLCSQLSLRSLCQRFSDFCGPGHVHVLKDQVKSSFQRKNFVEPG